MSAPNKPVMWPEHGAVLLFDRPSGELTQGLRAVVFFFPVERSDLLKNFGLSAEQGQQPGAYLQVSPEGQPFLPWNQAEEKSKMFLPPIPFFETLRFFGTPGSRWPDLEKHILGRINKLKKSGRAKTEEAALTIEGHASIYHYDELFSGLDFGLPSLFFVARGSPRNAARPLQVWLATSQSQQLELPLPLLVQLSKNLDFFEKVAKDLLPFNLDKSFSSPRRLAPGLLESALDQVFGNPDQGNAAAAGGGGEEMFAQAQFEEPPPQQLQPVDFQVNLLEGGNPSLAPGSFPHLEAAVVEASAEVARREEAEVARREEKRSPSRFSSYRPYRGYSTGAPSTPGRSWEREYKNGSSSKRPRH